MKNSGPYAVCVLWEVQQLRSDSEFLDQPREFVLIRLSVWVYHADLAQSFISSGNRSSSAAGLLLCVPYLHKLRLHLGQEEKVFSCAKEGLDWT